MLIVREEDAANLQETMMEMAKMGESENVNEAELMKIYTDMFKERMEKVEETKRNLSRTSLLT
jgi:hypothetical protein